MDGLLGTGAALEAYKQEAVGQGTPAVSRRELLGGAAAGAAVALLAPVATPAWAPPRSVTLTFAVAAPQEAAFE